MRLMSVKIAIIENYPDRAKYIEDLVTDTHTSFGLGKSDVSIFTIHDGSGFPNPKEYDSIILSGGTCGVYEKDKYPHIGQAIRYVKDLVEDNTKVLGICLGHQMMAEALGGNVIKTKAREIGWKKIIKCEEDNLLLEGIPDEFYSFEFHNDQVVVMPIRASVIASSAACPVEAFQYNNRAYGVQFHPEIKPDKAIEVYQSLKRDLESAGLRHEELVREAHEMHNKAISERIMYNFLKI
jgi:GMP synthase-like glutamine amidotransferase